MKPRPTRGAKIKVVPIRPVAPAPVKDIDTGARVGLNHPMGPLELADFVGLDTHLYICGVLYDGLHDPRFAAPPLLRQLVDAGHYGRKTGRGFYRYGPDGSRLAD